MKWTRGQLAQLRAEVEENQRRAGTVVWERLAPKYKYEIQNLYKGAWETFGAPGRHPLILDRDEAIRVAGEKADRWPGTSFRVVEVGL